MIKQPILRDCPHCGNRTGVAVLFRHAGHEEVYDREGESVGDFDNFYFLTECMTCSEVCLLYTWEMDADPQNISKARLLYPSGRKLSKEVPEEIKRTYEEAKKIISISPDGFAVLMRKALEYLCQDQGVKEYNLNTMLKELADKGVIPGHLARMTKAIRLIGNIGAHAGATHINKQEAELIDDFFVAIIEYVYVAPAKIKALEERLKKSDT